MNAIDEFLTRKSMDPGLICTAASAYLGDNYEAYPDRDGAPA